MNDCVFCKIVRGEISAKKVLETEKVFVCLDINPAAAGHSLIVPKQHYANIFDIDAKILQELITVAKNIAQLLKEKLRCSGINIVHASGKDAQQSVDHFHLHVVPRNANDRLDLWFHGKNAEAGDLDKVLEKLTN